MRLCQHPSEAKIWPLNLYRLFRVERTSFEQQITKSKTCVTYFPEQEKYFCFTSSYFHSKLLFKLFSQEINFSNNLTQNASNCKNRHNQLTKLKKSLLFSFIFIFYLSFLFVVCKNGLNIYFTAYYSYFIL